MKIIKQLRKKISFDHKIRPLKILWVRADYRLILKIFTLLGSFASIIVVTFLRNYLNDYIQDMFFNNDNIKLL